MVHHIVTFRVVKENLNLAEKLVHGYLNSLKANNPEGMRSYFYQDERDQTFFMHFFTFRQHDKANKHLKSDLFREYFKNISDIAGEKPLCRLVNVYGSFNSM